VSLAERAFASETLDVEFPLVARVAPSAPAAIGNAPDGRRMNFYVQSGRRP
jgi:hypothetical protein